MPVLRGVALALPFLAAACGAHTSDFAATAPYARKDKRPDQIEIYMSGDRVPANTKSVGIVRGGVHNASTFRPGDITTAESLTLLREEAAKNGIDGAYNVSCAPPGTVGQGTCSGTAFIYQ